MLYLSFQVTLTGDLDSTILEQKSGLKVAFYNRWTYGHQCDGAGCGTHLVFDAGMTPHRPVCGAKLSGVRVFPTAGVTTLIGCPRMPMPSRQYSYLILAVSISRQVAGGCQYLLDGGGPGDGDGDVRESVKEVTSTPPAPRGRCFLLSDMAIWCPALQNINFLWNHF